MTFFEQHKNSSSKNIIAATEGNRLHPSQSSHQHVNSVHSYSALMLASLITRAQRFTSSSMILRKRAGVLPFASSA